MPKMSELVQLLFPFFVRIKASRKVPKNDQARELNKFSVRPRRFTFRFAKEMFACAALLIWKSLHLSIHCNKGSGNWLCSSVITSHGKRLNFFINPKSCKLHTTGKEARGKSGKNRLRSFDEFGARRRRESPQSNGNVRFVCMLMRRVSEGR